MGVALLEKLDSEDGGRRAEDGGQSAEGRGRRTEGKHRVGIWATLEITSLTDYQIWLLKIWLLTADAWLLTAARQ